MPNWTAFAAVTGVVLLSLLVLSRLTQSAFDGESAGDPEPTADAGREALPVDAPPATSDALEPNDERVDDPPPQDRDGAAGGGVDPASMTTGTVLANVAGSQGLFALVLVGAAIYADIPADALGVAFETSSLQTGLALGFGVGLALYVANELGSALATWLGIDHDERVRELLAPGSPGGWAVLLVVVLPIIAVFEEFLFRAALIGAVEAGFGVSPWLLAAVSSIAFALGHGVQGSVGVAVTGLLGFVLAAVFVVTGSLLVVVVAHYLINALEFVVHEGLEVEWADTLGS